MKLENVDILYVLESHTECSPQNRGDPNFENLIKGEPEKNS